MSSVKKKPSNVPSILLSEAENDTLFNILGRGSVTLATGVCQLYTADPPARQRWSKRFCGIVCFIKDNPKRSYYIRLYDIKKDAIIWEQEIYNQFKYKTPREYFHTFEADEVQAGLNFASEDEAVKFKNVVEGKLLERHQKKLDRKRNQSLQPPNQPATSPVINSQAQTPITQIDIKSGSSTVGKSAAKSGKKDKKKKLTKDDISTPTQFRHVSHVGWDPNKGFDMNNLDHDMKSLFEQVGINNTTDIDKDTVEFIYDFVEQHGGMQKIKEQMKNKPPPAPPSSHAPPQPPPPRSTAPPPPTRNAGPAPPQRGGPPPQPPGRSMPPPPPARQMGSPPAPPSFNAPPQPPPQSAKGVPPLPPAAGVPPPPPPPAPPAAPPPPAAPAPPPGMPAAGSGRGALLDSIRQGAQLKPAGESTSSHGGGDPRANLLDAIRSGKTLKPAGKDDRPEAADPAQEGGIVGALAMALANRQKQLRMSDDEDEDDEDVDDEDEWDD